MLNQEEYDDISMAESLINDSQRDTESLTQVIIFLLYSSLQRSFYRAILLYA